MNRVKKRTDNKFMEKCKVSLLACRMMLYSILTFFSSSFKVSIQLPYARRTYRYNYVFHSNFGILQLISKKSEEKRLREEGGIKQAH